MEKIICMRPQDAVILIKKVSPMGIHMTGKQLAEALGISQSEVSESLDRSRFAGLIDESKTHVNTLALREFLTYGIRYCFPVQPGSIVRGVPTFISAPPINKHVSSGGEVFVWPDPEGTARGQSVTPLYPSVPAAVLKDEDFYKMMVIVDTLRMGRAREIELASKKLGEYLNNYGTGQSETA